MRGVLGLLIAFALIPAVCCAQTSGKGDLAPSTPLEVYQNAKRAMVEGRAATGFELLEVAARRGALGAQIEVARMSAKGKGAPLDEAKAFYFYRRIANDYADIDRRHSLAQFIAEAFRMSGTYLRNGIASANLKPDLGEASRLMLQAAGYFHEREAQYELATMYLNGEGVERNPRIAVGWLVNSARKRYAPAQAMLGDMMWRGKDVKRAPLEGLALLALAVDNALEHERPLVTPYYENAVAEADIETIRKTEEALKTLYHSLRLRSDGPPLKIEYPDGVAPKPEKGINMVIKDEGASTMTSETAPGQSAPVPPGGRGFGFSGSPGQ